MSEGRRFAPKKSIKNWAAYNEGLKRRYDLTIYVEDESIFDQPEPSGRRGRPAQYSDGLIEVGLTMKAVFRVPYRGVEGLLSSLLKLGNLTDKPLPDYTTFCLRAADIEVRIKTAMRSSHEPLHLLIDSTGLKIYGEGEWKVRTHGASKRRTWRKLHLAISEEQEVIVADLTENSVGDQEHLPKLLDEVPKDMSMDRVTADGIYDTWSCYDAATQHGADLCTPPRRNAIVPPDTSPRSHHPRSAAIRDCQNLGRTPWKVQSRYHVRSLVETAMFRFKTSFGERMFSRTFPRQKNEAMIKSNALNIFRKCAFPAYT